MERGNPCDAALEYLEKNEERPISGCLPSGSAPFYIPARKIRALFENKLPGLTLESVFLCPCYRCERDGGSVEDRSTHFNPLREQELRGDYALIYALLVYIRRPGLIRKFQMHELKLRDTMYLREGDFSDFYRDAIFDCDVLQRKVLEKQYSFLVRTLKPCSDITMISSRELLPIQENQEPKGEGTFAEVRCFEFQDDEYRSPEFGQHITRFARKIFKQGMAKPAAKEWNNLQSLSKEEKHPHLMVALSAYLHGDKFFILQEEAEQSLHDYLKGEGDRFKSADLWEQMSGVSDGLATLHQLYKGTKIAYHQDLKPANILIVKRVFKIADFGLLEFKPVSLLDDTGSTGVPNAHNTGYYAAPRQGKYTRDSDIWSLGCIMSELATCDIQGRDGVKSYREARIANGPSGRDTPRFFCGQVVKTVVLERHRLLYDCVQSKALTEEDTASLQFQKDFYSKEFFDLLNSMFKNMHSITNLLEVSSILTVPDADRIASTTERLRKAALPALALNNQIENLNLEQRMIDLEALNTSFGAHVTNFKKALNRRNKLRFPATTLVDLKQYIVNLQAKQHAQRRQQGLSSLKPFLERFEQLGELTKGLPKTIEFMGFVWGPVRFLLEVTDNRADAFQELLMIYGQVGRIQPSLSQYKELLLKKVDLTQTLSAAFQDILQVHTWVVVYFQQPLWIDLFNKTWRRHKLRFSSAIGRMASRLDLISSRADVSQFDSLPDISTLQDEQHFTTMGKEDLRRKQAIYGWLKPTEIENEQFHLSSIRADYPDTCQWLLDDDTFKEWFLPQYAATILPKLLWLNGKPGSGKTVLASRVVEEAKKLETASTVLFFYFKQEDSDRNNFLSMARTLLMQMLEQNPHTLDYFYSKCCNSVGTFLASRAIVEELLAVALRNCESAYIVLDGLDECSSRKERGEIVKWFREMIDSLPLDERDRLRCLFVSQNDSARKDYRDFSSITVDADNNENDIEAFSKVQSERLMAKLGISEHKANELAANVTASAEGIFLFAHLVWINLCGQSSIHGLDREMESFPTDLDKLDKAYARIMQRIMDKPARAERDEALLLLGWLVCAKRSLKIHEVQTMNSIDLDNGAVEFERRHFRVDPKDLCESLVDVREDGTIELVHMTAKAFLANSKFLDIVAENIRMATLCINYLNLPSFRAPYSEQVVLGGEYGFMEYAILYWIRHLEAGLTSSLSGQDELCEDLAESLEIFVEQHWNLQSPEVRSISSRTQEMLEIFSGRQRYQQIQQAIALTDKELKYFGHTPPEQCVLNFASIVLSVRNHLEAVVRHTTDKTIIEDLKIKYGTNLFRCPRFSCKHFTKGFSTADEREKHVERHERPARCTDEHCRGSKIGFATQAQLERHLKENHPDVTELDHVFPTDEEIAESLRDDYSDPEPEFGHEAEPSQPPVMTELAIAPEEPVPQPTQSHAPKRRKIKQDYECTHCDKKFKKKHNWQSHLASHGVYTSYTCSQCGTTCARSGDYTRHMRLHNPESAVTCGGVLMNGQQWGCGASFARADILRSHHKSKKGKQCIAARDNEEQSGPSHVS